MGGAADAARPNVISSPQSQGTTRERWTHAAIHPLVREMVEEGHDVSPPWVIWIARHDLLQKLDLI